jgi:hypothetical protein
MSHLAVNWLAVILATVASMALGFGWYMALAKPWMAAAGLTKADVDNPNPTPFIIGAACQLVMAYFVALLTPLLMGEMTVVNAVSTGAHMWIGFVATSMIINHRYQMKPWSLTLIDGGYLLGVLLLQGVVIGLFA